VALKDDAEKWRQHYERALRSKPQSAVWASAPLVALLGDFTGLLDVPGPAVTSGAPWASYGHPPGLSTFVLASM